MARHLMHLPATGQEITVATERGAANAEGRGWVRGPATRDLSDLTRPELDEIARQRDLDPSEFRTKADLVEALTD